MTTKKRHDNCTTIYMAPKTDKMTDTLGVEVIEEIEAVDADAPLETEVEIVPDEPTRKKKIQLNLSDLKEMEANPELLSAFLLAEEALPEEKAPLLMVMARYALRNKKK